MTVKVRCFPVRRAVVWQDPDPAHRSVEVTSSLPFAYSRNGRYTHRVRSAQIWPHAPGSGISITSWCGQGLSTSGRSPARVVSEVNADRPLCGTCHGRAIGAGQIDKEGTPLIYTPRSGVPNLGNCIWEHPGAGPYGYPRRCFRAAVDRIPEAPDGHKAGVCGEHSRKWPPSVMWRYEASLNNGGLTLGPHGQAALGPPPDPDEPRFERAFDDDLFVDPRLDDPSFTRDDPKVEWVDPPLPTITVNRPYGWNPDDRPFARTPKDEPC